MSAPKVTRVEYVLQYSRHDNPDESDWIDGSNPTSDEAKARWDLARARSPEGQELFPWPWRAKRRTTTEEVLPW